MAVFFRVLNEALDKVKVETICHGSEKSQYIGLFYIDCCFGGGLVFWQQPDIVYMQGRVPLLIERMILESLTRKNIFLPHFTLL